MNDDVRWVLDKHQCLNLRLIDASGLQMHLWITPRPRYCDRGHWQLNISAPGLMLDWADAFPRFYMSLESAIEEAESWLRWRLYQQTDTPMFRDMLANHDGRKAVVTAPADWGHHSASTVPDGSPG